MAQIPRCRPAATTLIRLLALKLPYAANVALKRKKKKKKKMRIQNVPDRRRVNRVG